MKSDFKSEKYPNYGKQWGPDQKDALVRDFNKGISLGNLCKLHGRNPNGLVSQLEAMQLIMRGPRCRIYKMLGTKDILQFWAVVSGDEVKEEATA